MCVPGTRIALVLVNATGLPMRTSKLVFTVLLTAALAAPAYGQSPESDPADAGWRAIKDDDGERAKELFGRALVSHPDDAVLHLGLGAAAHLLGRPDEAMRALSAALVLDPTLSVASRLLGEIARREGDLALAVTTYEQALAYAPDDVEMGSRLERLSAELERRSAATQVTVAFAGQAHGGLGDRAKRVLHGAYWRVAKLVGAYPAQGITVELDLSRPFQGLDGAMRASRGGDERISIDADGALADPEAFDRTLTSVLVHAMVASMAPTGVPAWFAEGLAQVVGTSDPAPAQQRLRDLGDIPWSGLESAVPSTADRQLRRDASLLIVRALLARIGSRSTRLLDELSDGQSLDGALAQFGFSYADLKADVVQSLEQ